MSDAEQKNEAEQRVQQYEAEVRRLTRERAALETKNEELTKKLRITEADRDRAEALFNMAMEWRGQVIDKLVRLEGAITELAARPLYNKAIENPPTRPKKKR